MGSALNTLLCKVGTTVYNEMQVTVIPVLEQKIEQVFSKVIDKLKDPDTEMFQTMRTKFKEKVKEKIEEVCDQLNNFKPIKGGGDIDDISMKYYPRHSNSRNKTKRKHVKLTGLDVESSIQKRSMRHTRRITNVLETP